MVYRELKDLYQKAGLGRLFRVYRGRLDRVYMGVLGDALNRGMEQKGPTSLKYVVPEHTSLVEYLVKDFNLRRRHARSVTADRRSFLAIALVEEGSKRPLGVVCCDSRDAAFFTDQLEDRIFQCLPHLVGAISAKEWERITMATTPKSPKAPNASGGTGSPSGKPGGTMRPVPEDIVRQIPKVERTVAEHAADIAAARGRA